jgi:putative salt-induced outer membrane protein YdiY
MKHAICLVLLLPVFLALCLAAEGQTPAAPVKPWTGNVGGGLAFTDGNSDTTNFNLTFAVAHDPKSRNVVKWNGLCLRGDKDHVELIDRTATTFRDEYIISKNLLAFAQLDYQRDKFKNIMFLWSPTAGVGYKLVNRDTLVVSVDNGLGGVWERNPGRTTRGSGALQRRTTA